MTALHATVHGSAAHAQSFSAPIGADLAEVERIFTTKLAGHRRHVARLVGHLESYRGKRLRPTLLLLAAGACGSITQSHHVLGAVVEMIHTATLVHDDVLDEAHLRRHASTINAGWGNQASILLGDMLFSHAFHLASSVDAAACDMIGAATNRVCEGELHQITERGNLELSEEEYLEVIDGKTAELTACCCRLGAMYAGADEEVVEKLAAYGRCLGLAFQIADDLLDLIGREDTTGKTLGTDLAQQKLTLPIIHMLQRLPKERAAQARRLLRKAPISRSTLLPLLEETGSLDYARDRAEEFSVQARANLSALPPSEFQTLLHRLTDWSIRREK
ncbi:MAG TPA: polyprenyl synthetase family protein [Gemmataceae bacterium]|jgi:octaprenyl-diphosphate synthase|nr:polyprenyl synthetase family protein [Gemmataceae bacterium]